MVVEQVLAVSVKVEELSSGRLTWLASAVAEPMITPVVPLEVASLPASRMILLAVVVVSEPMRMLWALPAAAPPLPMEMLWAVLELPMALGAAQVPAYMSTGGAVPLV